MGSPLMGVFQEDKRRGFIVMKFLSTSFNMSRLRGEIAGNSYQFLQWEGYGLF